MKTGVALLFGGPSAEYEVSLRTADAVLTHLDRTRFTIYLIGITRGGGWYWTDASPAEIAQDRWRHDRAHPVLLSPDPTRPGFLVDPGRGDAATWLRPDVLLPLLHGQGGEDGSLQGLFAWSGIPYVGCGVAASALCWNKDLTKRLLQAGGIPVVPWLCLPAARLQEGGRVLREIEERLPGPWFVKPARGGSSCGAGSAETAADLLPALRRAATQDTLILVERRVQAQEIEVAILEEGGEMTVSSCGEIDMHGKPYDYAAKYETPCAILRTEALLSPACAAQVREMAAKAFRLLGCRGLSRIDFFVTAAGEIYCNEVNTLPGFTPGSMYPRLMTGTRSFTALLTAMIEGALA